MNETLPFYESIQMAFIKVTFVNVSIIFTTLRLDFKSNQQNEEIRLRCVKIVFG